MSAGNGNGKNHQPGRPLPRVDSDAAPSTQPSERGDVDHKLDGIGLSLSDVASKVDVLIHDSRNMRIEVKEIHKEHESLAASLDEHAAGMIQLQSGQTRLLGAVSEVRGLADALGAGMLQLTATVNDVARMAREAKAESQEAKRASMNNEAVLDFAEASQRLADSAVQAFVGRRNDSLRARAEWRSLTISGIRKVGHAVVVVAKLPITQTLVAVAIAAAIAKIQGLW